MAYASSEIYRLDGSAEGQEMKGWTCYPVWGLEIAENGFGLDQPIFGDATLVPRSFLEKQSPADSTSAAVLSGAGPKKLLQDEGVDMAGPAPIERLIDIPPGAFIAVRRQNPAEAQAYAESIRALLTASAVLTSGVAKGFAMTPIPLHWSAMPSCAQLTATGLLQIKYEVVANNFIHLTPIGVSHKTMRESWENGTPIQGTWKLHKEDALSKALVGNWGSLRGLRKRVRGAAITLARAMESTDPTISVLFGAVALERLLQNGAASFKELEDMAASIFSGPNGPAEIARLFANRHKVAHEATTPTNSSLHAQEISAAWGVILTAAIAARELTTVDAFLEHLKGRVLSRQVANQLRSKGQLDLADSVERASLQLGKS